MEKYIQIYQQLMQTTAESVQQVRWIKRFASFTVSLEIIHIDLTRSSSGASFADRRFDTWSSIECRDARNWTVALRYLRPFDRNDPWTQFSFVSLQAENDNNPMSETRRLQSLTRWKEWLQSDIEVYRKMKNSAWSVQNYSPSFSATFVFPLKMSSMLRLQQVASRCSSHSSSLFVWLMVSVTWPWIFFFD